MNPNDHLDNLVYLPVLNGDSVLKYLFERFKGGKIYTWAGTTLIACNPFQEYQNLYNEETKYQYKISNKKKKHNSHIYAIASKVHEEICNYGNTLNQTVIVSGESGSGKTCSAKYILEYLSYLETCKKQKRDELLAIEQWILETNPILEAFGNASTERNHNSSRFGKFLKLHYCPNNQELVSASINTYLLEKTRVIRHFEDSVHNFHIFYQMTNCCNEDEAKKWILPPYLLSSQKNSKPKYFEETKRAMKNININDETQEKLFKILSAILHLSHLSFVSTKKDVEKYSVEMTDRAILDIFGFEIFKKNCFEQLCINYANERIQQHFVKHFLQDELNLFQAEAIPFEPIQYDDNRPCLDLLDTNFGIFGLLNERNSFIVKHYAGHVTYKTTLMIEKNKDNIPSDIIEMLSDSQNEFIASMFSHVADILDVGKFKRKQTVLHKFKSSLDNLLGVISSSKVSYVRCIKPNSSQSKNMFDEKYVESQLRACGVIETISISRMLFPIRFLYSDFIRKYGIVLRKSKLDHYKDKENIPFQNQIEERLSRLSSQKRKSRISHYSSRRGAILDPVDHQRQLTVTIIRSVSPNKINQCELGKTRVFMSNSLHEDLETWYQEMLTISATIIQKAWFIYRMKIKLIEIRAVAIIKAGSWQNTKMKMEKAALVIQREFRKYLNCSKSLCETSLIILKEKNSDEKKENETVIKRPIEYRCKYLHNERITEVVIMNNPVPQFGQRSLFYKDGILSVRRPTGVKIKFRTKTHFFS
ncbi:Unconventional myosin-X [Nymphon striatum]|nr:Unconventional myosin-X [Nymphon striatum]